MKPLTIRLAVVDLAGTTVDFGSCAPAGVFVDLFRRHGITASMEEARQPMGLQKREHIQTMVSMPGIAAQWQAKHRRTCTSEDIEGLYQEFIPLQIESLPKYSDLIPGTMQALAEFRKRGIPVAATTGYNQEMMRIVLENAAPQGFVPDAAVCADHVSSGRPAPWMIFAGMERLNVYPPASVINVGDTLADVSSGRNAGVWSIGVAATGNMAGANLAEWQAVLPAEQQARLSRAREQMLANGAHYVVNGISDCPDLVDKINARLATGERP
jgi:phosphonoacetaldehyde hydrolase